MVVVHTVRIANVLDLRVFLGRLPRALDVSPHMRSYTHLPDIPNDKQQPSYVQWRPCLWGALAKT